MFGQLAALPAGGAVPVVPEVPAAPDVPLAGVVAVVAVVVVGVAADELVAALAMTAPPPARAPIAIVVASAF